ncbi:MAG: branched-chain amino acid ABC transporter permease [Armatimonadetes bacterium]|nr:branched-chain amino acid ABC transporter permease [Armatimonadota bacterium]
MSPVLAAFEFSELPEQLVIGLMTGAIYALIALGYTMVYGILRLINFAHGEIFMLGAYIGLFISTAAIGSLATRIPTEIVPADTLTTAAYVMFVVGVVAAGLLYYRSRARRTSGRLIYFGVGTAVAGILSWLLAQFQPQAITLVVMMLGSMIGCAIVGVIIEFLAYRPMRSQPRIAALITAIGVSLFLQFTGQLFLPNAPPPSIKEDVNPYRGSFSFYLKAPPENLALSVSDAFSEMESKQAVFEGALIDNDWDRFNLPPEGKVLRDEMQEAQRAVNDIDREVRQNSTSVNVPTGQFIMFVTAILLMIALRHLVMKTTVGRSMRAVSHDMQAASLMGISVSKVVTITFIIGSALAGAGAMMNATFMGTPLTTFYGLQPGVKAFVAAVLGGIGNIPGAVLGGLIMGLAEAMVVWSGFSNLKDAIAFVILIIVLLVRPGGLLGSAVVEKV